MNLKHSFFYSYHEADERKTCVQFFLLNGSFINADPRFCKIQTIKLEKGPSYFWLTISIYNQNRLSINLEEEDLKFIRVTKWNPYEQLIIWERKK
ncbi:hypothetical protein [Candidatus Harpocratesius sp.]